MKFAGEVYDWVNQDDGLFHRLECVKKRQKGREEIFHFYLLKVMESHFSNV